MNRPSLRSINFLETDINLNKHIPERIMSNVENNVRYCRRCEVEGRKTALFYNNPPNRDVDTWSKALQKKSDYRCLRHVREDAHLHGSKAGRAKHKAKSESIEQYHQRRVTQFYKMWHDDTLVDDKKTPIALLSDPDRLMWVFIRYNIRKASLGFTPVEMVEVIREADIEFDISKKVAEWKEDAKARGLTLLVREQVEPELIKIYVSMKDEMQEAHRRGLINSVRGMATAANGLWEKRPKAEWEKLVTTPGHRDPEGNLSPRIHLLSEFETLRKRQEKMGKKISGIERTMQHESEILASQHIDDKGEGELVA